MPNTKPGDRFGYAGDHGLGQAARIADPDVPEQLNTLASDSAELDLADGTEVSFVGRDDERGVVLVEWTDRQGNPRITSVPADDFGTIFGKV